MRSERPCLNSYPAGVVYFPQIAKEKETSITAPEEVFDEG
jgi:hypothetical protein